MSMSFARIVTTCWGVMTVTRWSRTIAASVIPISSIVRSISRPAHRTYRFALGAMQHPLPNSGDGLEGVEDTAGDQIVLDPPPEHLLVQVRPAVDLAEGESHPGRIQPGTPSGPDPKSLTAEYLYTRFTTVSVRRIILIGLVASPLLT